MEGHLPLARSELPIDAVSLARYLLGKVLVRELPEGVAGDRIIETQAYVVRDAAGHAYRGMTRRNRSAHVRPRLKADIVGFTSTRPRKVAPSSRARAQKTPGTSRAVRDE
jgi:Methylpurine-DNA glycosylase (MPG)